MAAQAAVSDVVPPNATPAGTLLQEYAPDEVGHTEVAVRFLQRHCLECHGPEVQEAGLRVDRDLPNEFVTRSVAQRWSEVLNMLNSGAMPPEGRARPSRSEVSRLVDWITRERLRGEKARHGTDVVLRRMTRTEYNNTIRDLLGVRLRPADDFPADPSAGGFDNNGSALTVSPLHLEMYLQAARDVVDQAIVIQADRPSSIKWRFQLEDGNQGMDRYRVEIDGQRIIVNGGNNQFRDGMSILRINDWDTGAGFRHFLVPHPGYYAVRIRAGGIVPTETAVRHAGPELHEQRQQRRETEITDADERRRSRESFDKWVAPYVGEHFASDRAYRYGPPRIKVTGYLGAVRRILAEFDVDAPADAPKVYEIVAWFDPQHAGVEAKNVYRIPTHDYSFWMQKLPEFPRPELLIDWMELEGPLYDEWPPPSHRRIFIDSPNQGRDESAYARDVLKHFMRRAYRRPVTEQEVASKFALFRRARSETASFEEAMKIPLVAVLTSPHFLYLVEPTAASGAPSGARLLNEYELAARLSYFLWSSMPDEELSLLAERGELNKPGILAAQADRLLADPRVAQFVENFTGQWLDLREVGANPPAENIYRRYDDHLEASMRGESEAFFAHVLHENLSVLNFIRSDFVTINERLARYYDISGIKGDHFRPVPVPEAIPRGGLLTQASILTVTSNGTRTSPVWRGEWILTKLLGDPPPPPPPNVGDIPPGVPGIDKVTVRERLRLHREQPQCAHCHEKIDPLGFALENFNAAGEWRDRESVTNAVGGPNDPPIDARAQLPGGVEFIGITGLQEEMLHRDDQFLRCLAEALYVYALGRELGFADEPVIEEAVQHMQQHGNTLRSLIHHIVASELFRSK